MEGERRTAEFPEVNGHGLTLKEVAQKYAGEDEDENDEEGDEDEEEEDDDDDYNDEEEVER